MIRSTYQNGDRFPTFPGRRTLKKTRTADRCYPLSYHSAAPAANLFSKKSAARAQKIRLLFRGNIGKSTKSNLCPICRGDRTKKATKRPHMQHTEPFCLVKWSLKGGAAPKTGAPVKPAVGGEGLHRMKKRTCKSVVIILQLDCNSFVTLCQPLFKKNCNSFLTFFARPHRNSKISQRRTLPKPKGTDFATASADTFRGAAKRNEAFVRRCRVQAGSRCEAADLSEPDPLREYAGSVSCLKAPAASAVRWRGCRSSANPTADPRARPHPGRASCPPNRASPHPAARCRS